MSRASLIAVCLLAACGGASSSSTSEESVTRIGWCTVRAAPIDGDTLAEQPWTDASQTFFYTFTGNGTVDNTWGTFVMQIEWPCLRTAPYCAIATPAPKPGTFYTYGSTIELDYDSGEVAYFDASINCRNAISLAGDDQGRTLRLTVSPIAP